jgi:hypothetical protein
VVSPVATERATTSVGAVGRHPGLSGRKTCESSVIGVGVGRAVGEVATGTVAVGLVDVATADVDVGDAVVNVPVGEAGAEHAVNMTAMIAMTAARRLGMRVA